MSEEGRHGDSGSSASPDRPSSSSRPQHQHRRSDSITKTPRHRNFAHAGSTTDGGKPKVTVPAGAEGLMGMFSPPLAGGNDGNDEQEKGAAAAAAKPRSRKMGPDVPPGAAGLVGMFAPPPPPPAATTGSLQRQQTEPSSNVSSSTYSAADDPSAHERQALLPPPSNNRNRNRHGQQRYYGDDVVSPSTDMRTLHDMFRPPPSPSSSAHSANTNTTTNSNSRRQLDDSTSSHRTLPTQRVHVNLSATDRSSSSSAYQRSRSTMDNMKAGAAARYLRRASSSAVTQWQRQTQSWSDRMCRCSARDVSSVVIGSFTFVLFQIVFCLAESSAVAGARYGAKDSVLGPMMKASALGAIVQVPIFVFFLSTDLPSLYPCVDLFLAPFMVQISNAVHTSLRTQGLGDDIDTFLATFFVLNAIGLLLTALGNVAASKFKLANLGSFLPYSVICGFFSYVGLTLWMLAIAVDTGHTWDAVLFSGDMAVVKSALVHHIPGVVVGVCMRVFGRIYPPLTPLAVLFTIAAGYIIMFATGTTFEEAAAEGWFYSRDDFIYEGQKAPVGFASWAVPAPFGILVALFLGSVNFNAVVSALPHALGMAVIYLLRCSLHAAALRKSTTAMLRGAKSSEPPTLPAPLAPTHKRERSVSDAAFEPLNDVKSNESNAKPPTGMAAILLWYGICMAIGGVIGGVGVLPGVAVGAMLFKLGAGGIAPQHGGSLLLFAFYISNFTLVRYIPKPAFTCLLIMCSLDMLIDWFFDSFKKTKSAWEWVVCPVIVTFSFLLGQLMAVAVGVALSTFIFVGHMNQSGVVKFLANGLTVRSTIERVEDVAEFLDKNGDLIQICVLQNYLFFGNATSVDQYVQTMFEDVPEHVGFDLPPIPKYLVIDFTIVTGCDTSAVDVFSDIISLCKSNGCEIIMTGLSSNLKATFAAAGVKPTRGLRFLPDIEAALGKAEDALVRHVFKKVEKSKLETGERRRLRLMSVDDDGFRFALRQIDEQHGISFATDLEALQKYIKPIELEPGESLFGDDSKFDETEDRGVFFIETGYMKVERDPTYTMTHGSKASLRRKIGPGIACRRVAGEGGSIGHLNARSATIGREAALLKATTGFRSRTSHTFRLARIGPGWIIGAIEGASGLRNPGIHIAVTDCRLHHLSFSSVQELERTNPLLVLRLFKMMSHIMSRRQELTIEQFATLHSIMTSPASTKPLSRLTMGAIQSAMSYQ